MPEGDVELKRKTGAFEEKQVGGPGGRWQSYECNFPAGAISAGDQKGARQR